MATTPKRLNPFAFSAETDALFTLFIVAAVMFTIGAGVNLWSAIQVLDPTASFADVSRGSILEKTDRSLASDEYWAQVRDNHMNVAWSGIGGSALIFVPAVVALFISWRIYRVHPSRIRRKKCLRPLTPENDSLFHREATNTLQQTGLATLPSIEIGQGTTSTSAQAFGVHSLYVIGLGGKLPLLFRKAPQRFKAILLHEAGHIANRDVSRAYSVQALWTGTIVVVVGSLIVGTAATWYNISHSVVETPDQISTFGTWIVATILAYFNWIQLFFTLVLVGILRASLLRTREIYADWRAALWGAENTLRDIFNQHLTAKVTPFRKLFGLHPTSLQRIRAFDDPSLLFRSSVGVSLVVGILIGLIFNGSIFLYLELSLRVLNLITAIGASLFVWAYQLSSNLLGYLATPFVPGAGLLMIVLMFAPFFIVGLLVARTLALQTQRITVAEMALHNIRKNSYLQLWKYAVAVGLGLEIGYLLAPFDLLSPMLRLRTGTSPIGVLTVLGWLGYAIAGTWLCLAYAQYFTRRVLGRHTGAIAPKWKTRLLDLGFALMFFALQAFLVLNRYGTIGSLSPQSEDHASALSQTILTPAFVLCGLIFGITYVVVAVHERLRPAQCPICHTSVVDYKQIVGEICANCGAALAEWIMTPSGTRLSESSMPEGSRKKNLPALSSLVFGIITLSTPVLFSLASRSLSLVYVINSLSVASAFLAIVFGLWGLFRTGKGPSRGRLQAVIGIATAVIGVILASNWEL